MQTFRFAGCLFSDLFTRRLASHAAASFSAVTQLERQGSLHRSAVGSYLSLRPFVSAGTFSQAPAGTNKHVSLTLLGTTDSRWLP